MPNTGSHMSKQVAPDTSSGLNELNKERPSGTTDSEYTHQWSSFIQDPMSTLSTTAGYDQV
jgi:hypothetical protein